MLVLSRKTEESVLIGAGGFLIRVKVLRIRGGEVRLGFEAPDGTRILRQELVEDLTDLGLSKVNEQPDGRKFAI